MKENLVEKVEKFVSVEDKIAVAVSGGEDSMALLYAFSKTSANFFVVNVEHGIRGENSIRDSKFVEDYCRQNSIGYLSFSVNAKDRQNGETLEENARSLRYEIFEKLLNDKKCTKVALAHHKRDQAETILMRIMRGTGITGLRGMNDNVNGYIRPFLDVTKEEIVSYIKENNIPFVLDETNLINDCTRNILRNEIFPKLKEIYSDTECGLIRLSEHAKETEEFLKTCDIDVPFDGKKAYIEIKSVHPYLLKRAIRQAFTLLKITKDIEDRHVNIIMDFFDADNGQSLDMPFGVKVTKEYDKLVFYKAGENKNFEIPFNKGVTFLGDLKIQVEKGTRDDIKKGKLLFDISKVDGAVIRNRRNEDYFKKFGGGTKSLGDYFTDIKIPKRIRDDIPLVARGSEILIIVGVEISDFVKIDENTKDQDIYCIIKE